MSATPVYRAVARSWRSQPTIEGAGVRLKRAFGFGEVPELDPFLLLDAFGSDNPADYLPGFPWHPHRGIETITYVLEGEVEHADSLGNRGVIAAGDIQWMTAGGGIIHQEMPKGSRGKRLAGFQLWANLPAKEKMMEPRYREVGRAGIPIVERPDGTVVRVVAGEVDSVRGPVREIVTDPRYLDVTMPSGASLTLPVPPEHTVFAYLFEGEARFQPAPLGKTAAGSVVLFGPGEAVTTETESHPARFLLVSGRPLKEPVAWRGPIVMNSEDELRKAFDELRAGTFVKMK
ncbi:MAG TPA: pirin family protein [Thermoanaerobaculia bacterium]|nr:pirin family protein [Thermoanaerobaculia bacterium]